MFGRCRGRCPFGSISAPAGSGFSGLISEMTLGLPFSLLAPLRHAQNLRHHLSERQTRSAMPAFTTAPGMPQTTLDARRLRDHARPLCLRISAPRKPSCPCRSGPRLLTAPPYTPRRRNSASDGGTQEFRAGEIQDTRARGPFGIPSYENLRRNQDPCRPTASPWLASRPAAGRRREDARRASG